MKFLVVLSIIGVLLIVFAQVWLGVLFLCPAIIAIILKVVKEAAFKARNNRWQQEREERWQRQRQQQNALIEQYKHGQLIQAVIKEICTDQSARILPSDIYVENREIYSWYNGERKSYRFYEHRVQEFEGFYVQSREEGDNAVKPLVAVAIALNYHLGNNYDIFDKGYGTDEDGDYYASYRGVHMRIKPNKSF